MAGDFVVHPIRWDRCPSAAGDPHARAWITLQSHRGLAYNTLDAYSRSLERCFRFLEQLHSSCVVATRAEVGLYLDSLQVDGTRFSNATIQLLLTAVRLFHAYLTYENLLSKLSDVLTPAGPTPRQLGAGLVQITSVRGALPASTLTDSRSNGAGSREPD